MTEHKYKLSQGDDENYLWGADHAYIRVAGTDTNGAYSIIEDNLAQGFYLPPHLHRHHAETFIVIAGEVEYTIGEQTIKGTPGTVLHVPPGTTHSARAIVPSKQMMIYAPAGFEELLREVHALGEAANTPETLAQLNAKYDIVSVGD